MLVAAMVWFLGLFGVAPSPEQLALYASDFSERRHHIGLDFNKTWGDDDAVKGQTLGLSYEYLVDRRFHGVSFEVLAQMYGGIFGDAHRDFFTGGGLAYYPIRNVKIFAAAGSLFDNDKVYVRGRVGVGYRLNFFMLGVMPNLYVESTSDGSFSFSFGARIQY